MTVFDLVGCLCLLSLAGLSDFAETLVFLVVSVFGAPAAFDAVLVFTGDLVLRVDFFPVVVLFAGILFFIVSFFSEPGTTGLFAAASTELSFCIEIPFSVQD
ncbi:MAG: hypothetical protein JSU83_04675 [Deltaproteobacteria bacterium]|nr:MAG: hypothetical protein JSU83_04675 [Deltaproteobacteria bacterium]